MEQERLMAVIGLAFNMPYVPADNARTDMDVMHFSMTNNAFNFSTAIQSIKSGVLLFFSYIYFN